MLHSAIEVALFMKLAVHGTGGGGGEGSGLKGDGGGGCPVGVGESLMTLLTSGCLSPALAEARRL
eukprot:scaffold34024_cov118-Isochrysis_galbana.AAC.2